MGEGCFPFYSLSPGMRRWSFADFFSFALLSWRGQRVPRLICGKNYELMNWRGRRFLSRAGLRICERVRVSISDFRFSSRKLSERGLCKKNLRWILWCGICWCQWNVWMFSAGEETTTTENHNRQNIVILLSYICRSILWKRAARMQSHKKSMEQRKVEVLDYPWYFETNWFYLGIQIVFCDWSLAWPDNSLDGSFV